MLIIKLALRNLTRHTKKTVLIGVLIALGMALLFFVNSVFESTNQGLKSSFVRSLTGDAAISAQSDVPFGLFGVEIPIISTYENIPPLSGYNDMVDFFDTMEGTEAWTPVVSAAGFLEVDNSRTGVPVFGIDPDSYFSVCSDIEIVKGDIKSLSEGGVFLNSRLLEEVESDLGRSLEIGEPVKLSMYSDGSFRIRKGIFSGVHSYVSYTEPLDRVVLADATIVRSLANYTMGFAEEDNKNSSGTDETFNMDDLFSEPSDAVADTSGFTLDTLEDILSDTEKRTDLVMTDAASWSFVLFKAADNSEYHLRKNLKREAEKNGWDVNILNWRNAAGLSAQAVFALQSAFYGGIVFIVLGAVLVIMNALVISVFERVGEIGTMRGIGAEKSFIRKLFIAESMILTMTASAAGILLGIMFSLLASKSGITIENDLLITLFGGTVIKPSVGFIPVVKHLFMAAVVGSVAWIYPVSLAMKIQPVEIMGKG